MEVKNRPNGKTGKKQKHGHEEDKKFCGRKAKTTEGTSKKRSD